MQFKFAYIIMTSIQATMFLELILLVSLNFEDMKQ